ncbi:hypothetical protein AWM70_11425 [Paenibacillus yonginensis]|uniref:DUF5668 domain-containing protein n=1 Tax=Paenibacillus yonginensis TaxID=1462996 RepID=A0A1B1N122_9BACL|nr:hypothetical protein [Paenibacillus yonginensis]ANS75137.1 hypothetical protein AWM70_11425 [Paenibacillus yonginensis]
MSDQNKLTTGVLILAAGLIILLGKWGVFSFIGTVFWPLLLLALGILLHILYAGRRLPAAALVPGGALIVYGVVFLIATLFGYGTLHYLWPGFIFGIALGLFLFDAASTPRPSGIFPLAIALLAVSVLLFGITLFSFSLIYLLAFILIVGGVWLIAFRGRSRSRW